MSYEKQRDEFLERAQAEGMKADTARKLLQVATTLHRLALAELNGDWPASNGGKRAVSPCPKCERKWVLSTFKRDRKTGVKVCPDCAAESRARALMPRGFKAVINGDPRGAVLKIVVPSGKTNDFGQEGIIVPARPQP